MVQRGFNVNVFMSTCFLLTLFYLRASLCRAGWVVCFGGAWREYMWGSKIFIEFSGSWSATSLSMNVSLPQLFFMYFAEVNYLPGFCVGWYSGGKGFIVTWRQILKCDMKIESMHIGESGRAFMCVCAYVWCLCACTC